MEITTLFVLYVVMTMILALTTTTTMRMKTVRRGGLSLVEILSFHFILREVLI